MCGLAILQSYHAEIFPKIRDENPVADAAIRLHFTARGLKQSSLTPLALDVWAFA